MILLHAVTHNLNCSQDVHKLNTQAENHIRSKNTSFKSLQGRKSVQVYSNCDKFPFSQISIIRKKDTQGAQAHYCLGTYHGNLQKPLQHTCPLQICLS